MNKRQGLQTPRDKYMNDPEYNHLVRTLEHFIESAHFTPSELREAAVLASINYEMRHIRSIQTDPELDNALQVLDRKFVNRRSR